MSDLTTQEQAHVRTALRFMRTRFGAWAAVSQALQFKESTLANVMAGHPASASMAIRVARLAGVPVDDVLTGKYPAPGTCPHCGHRPELAVPEAGAILAAR